MKALFVNRMHALFVVLGSLLILFIALPLTKMILISKPDVLWQTFLEEKVRDAIWLSLYTAFIATLIAFICGVPLAYILTRFQFPGKQLVEAIVDIPIVVPHTAAGIALIVVFGRRFLMGRLFERLGIRFVSAVPGIVIAMLFVSLPFLVNSAKEGFAAVDPRLEKVARTLGASPWQSFYKVSFPLAWRSILSGAIMMWARGLSEFGAVVILTYHPMVAPILIFERFEAYGLKYSRPVAVLLILICLGTFALLRTIARQRERES